ncbi:unnamed protein product [Paramecium octaurelia]|uniref:UDP-N-acetylglucosamine--peptide N-acetylglucosaminyltransferase SPINDLY n=1 Tax=Paramecium octaurelia TaxID=43137 RepID=A0A8S1YMJ5_PAROT|nr:unnamed protein product [Paramecium octaurelia]
MAQHGIEQLEVSIQSDLIQQRTEQIYIASLQNLQNYKIEEALELIDEALKLNPLFSQAFISRGELYLGKNMDDWTVEDAIKVGSLSILRNGSFDQKTKGISQKDLLIEALQNYQYSIQLTPQYGLIFQRIGRAIGELGNYNDELRYYDKAIEIDDQCQLAYYKRGILNDEIGNKDQALIDYTKAIDLDPKNIQAYAQRGNLQYYLGNWDKALIDFNKTIELDPQQSFTYYNRGVFYQNSGNNDQALIDLNQAIDLDPHIFQAYHQRAILYHDRGNQDQALFDYTKAIELYPYDAKFYFNRGILYNNMGQIDKGILDFSKSIELNPYNAKAYYSRGLLEYEIGNTAQTLLDYTKAIELDPNYASFFYNRGFLYQQMGNKNLALDDYNRAIELDPEDPQSYCNRGMIFKEIDELDKALIDYNKAIELNPQDAAFYFNRGILYNKMGNKYLSLSDYNQAIDLDPNNVQAYYNRGALHLIMENKAQAVLDFNKAIELDPRDESSYSYRGLIYQKMGDKNQALQDYDKAIELNPKNPLLYYQRDYNSSALLKELNQNDKAFQDYNKALELDSNNLFALANLGDLYYIRQNYTLSFDQYYRVINLLINIKSQQINQLNLQEWHAFIIQEKFKLLQEIQDSAVQLRLELQKPPSQSNYDQSSINDIKRQFRCLERKIKIQLKPQTEFSKLEKKRYDQLNKQVAQSLQMTVQQNPTVQLEKEAKLKRMDDQFIEEDSLYFTKLKIIINYIITMLCFNLCIALYKQSQRINKNYHKQIRIIQLKINEKYQKEQMIKFQLLNQRLKQMEKHLTLPNQSLRSRKRTQIAIIELAMQQSKDLQEESNSQLGEFVTKLSTAKYQKEQNVHQKTGIHDALIIIKYLGDRSVSVKEMNDNKLRVLILDALEKNKKLKVQLQHTENPIIYDSFVIDTNSSCQAAKYFAIFNELIILMNIIEFIIQQNYQLYQKTFVTIIKMNIYNTIIIIEQTTFILFSDSILQNQIETEGFKYLYLFEILNHYLEQSKIQQSIVLSIHRAAFKFLNILFLGSKFSFNIKYFESQSSKVNKTLKISDFNYYGLQLFLKIQFDLNHIYIDTTALLLFLLVHIVK